jgi:hypothetical protein
VEVNYAKLFLVVLFAVLFAGWLLYNAAANF